MKQLYIQLVTLLSALTSTYAIQSSSQIRFGIEQNKVYRLNVTSLEELDNVKRYISQKNLDTWSTPRIGIFDILMNQNDAENIKKLGTKSSVIIEDIISAIKESLPTKSSLSSLSSPSFLDYYHTFEEVNEWMRNLTLTRPDIVSEFTIGKTFEGRNITGLRISNQENIASKRSIVISSMMHGREWITTAAILVFIDTIIGNYDTDLKIKHLIDTFEWSIIPILNVDGYVYTHEHDRLWRKNRQLNYLPHCIGVDIERNWGYKWGLGSLDPCSETYQGKEPFDTIESKALSNYISSRNVIAYFDLHAYGELFMYPFSYACVVPRDEEDLLEAGLGATQAIFRKHGIRYQVGSVCELLTENSGGPVDWTYADRGIKYSYTIELRDTGKFGFLLPERFIRPSGDEITGAFLYLAEFIDLRQK